MKPYDYSIDILEKDKIKLLVMNDGGKPVAILKIREEDAKDRVFVNIIEIKGKRDALIHLTGALPDIFTGEKYDKDIYFGSLDAEISNVVTANFELYKKLIAY
jgi:hypothetical protein